MDPVSLTASIAGLISMVDLIYGYLHKYIKTARGAEKTIRQLATEMTSLSGVLNSLRLVAVRFESEDLGLSTRERSLQMNHFHDCSTTIRELQSLLAKDAFTSSDSKLRSLNKKLHWPLSETETKELVERVDRQKQTLALALNADTMLALLQGLSNQADISNGIEDIRNRINAVSMNDSRIRVLNSFAPNVEPQKYLAAASRLRQMGTGLWICKDTQFQAWIGGIPGAGKTILTATIIDEVTKHVSQGRGLALAYYFCDYRTPATQDASSILASLIKQLALQDEECYGLAERLHEKTHQNLGLVSSYRVEDLLPCLSAMIATLDHAYLVVDALDECINDPGTSLDTLHAVGEFDSDNFSCLFTGRGELDIEERFGDYSTLSIAARSQDIRLYVDSEIATRTASKSLRIRDPALREEIRENLVIKAEGMFRWVTCQLDHICGLSSDKARRNALTTLPPDLPTTYQRILDRVNLSGPDAPLIVQKTLRWILWAVRPLPLPALSEALSISDGDTYFDRDGIVDPEAIIKLCGSLVRKIPGTNTLDLAHYTVKEFLTRIDIDTAPGYIQYRADYQKDNVQLAKTCLTYLSLDDFDTDDTEDWFRSGSRMNSFKFLRYCVCFWDMHARAKEDDVSLLVLLQTFFGPKRSNQYLAWVSCNAFVIASKDTDLDHEWLDEDTDLRNTEPYLEWNIGASPLHSAATLLLPSLCGWLLEEKCEVNHWAANFRGYPLDMALLSYYRGYLGGTELQHVREDICRCRYQTIEILIKHQADLNPSLHAGQPAKFGASYVTKAILEDCNDDVVQLLLDAGSLCDRHSLTLLADRRRVGSKVFQNLTEQNVENDERPFFRDLAVKEGTAWDHVANSVKYAGMDAKSLKSRYFSAAQYGRLEAMEKLIPFINSGTDGLGLDTKNELNFTCLHIACERGHAEIANLLLEKGISIDLRGSSGETALMQAAAQQNHRCVQVLLYHGADLKATDKWGSTALHWAAKAHTTQMFDTLMQSATAGDPGLYTKTEIGLTLLHHAAMTGSLSVIHYILDHFPQASLCDRTNDERTCLHFVASSDSVPTLKYFLDQGLTSVIDMWDSNGLTPVSHAILYSAVPLEMIGSLHQSGAKLDAVFSSKGQIALFHQIGRFKSQGHQVLLDCFTYILHHTEDINHCDTDGNNALHHLFQSLPEHPSACIEIVCRALLVRGCSMTRSNSEGISPFQMLVHGLAKCQVYQAKHERIEENVDDRAEFGGTHPVLGIIMLVLRCVKADAELLGAPHTVLCEGTALLHYAVCTKESPFIEAILMYDKDVDKAYCYPHSRVDPTSVVEECLMRPLDSTVRREILSLSRTLDQVGYRGLKPIHLAAKYGHSTESLDALMEFAININSLDKSGCTPLHYAAKRGRIDLARSLVAHGAIVNVASDRGTTPYMEALKANQQEIARFLEDHRLHQEQSAQISLASDKHDIYRRKDLIAKGLFASVELGNIGEIERLLNEGADVNARNGEYETPAMIAAAAGEFDVLDLLKERGADFHARRYDGVSALHYACVNGRIRTLPGLLELGLRFIDSDLDGLSAIERIDWADSEVEEGFHDFIMRHASPAQLSANQLSNLVDRTVYDNALTPLKWILGQLSPTQRHAAFNDPKARESPLVRAASMNHTEFMRILLDAGADINIPHRTAGSPLSCAATLGRFKAVQFLAERGADQSNAIEAAKHYPEIQDWLREHYSQSTPSSLTSQQEERQV